MEEQAAMDVTNMRITQTITTDRDYVPSWETPKTRKQKINSLNNLSAWSSGFCYFA